MQKQGEKRTDDTLVTLAQAGDHNAEQALLERYYNLARYCARGFFVVEVGEDDLTQECMLGLYQAVKCYQVGEKKSFKNYAYLCMRNKMIDAYKRVANGTKRDQSQFVGIESIERLLNETDPDDSMILADERRELNVMMSRVLTGLEFKVFTLYMDGATTAEICEETGKPAKSVDNAIQRSKKKLKNALTKSE